MSFFLLVSLALADAITMPTASSCPPGANPRMHGHGGIACELAECETDGDCNVASDLREDPEGKKRACRTKKICIHESRYVTNTPPGRRPTPDDWEPRYREYTRVAGECAEDGSCSSGDCAEKTVCVWVPESKAGQFLDPSGWACSTVSGSALTVASGIALLALAGRRRDPSGEC